MSYRAKFVGIGSQLGTNKMTNHDLEQLLNTSDEWITQRTGIKARYWADAETCTSDLAYEASLKAIADAKIEKEEIDMIVFATISPDHEFPGPGCFLQAKLDLPGIPAIEVRQQCSGFIYGLSLADLYIRSGEYKTVLVVGAEVHSKGLDKTPEGRDVSVLFGDGAGAAILTRTKLNDSQKDSHILSTHIHAEGAHAKALWTAAPGSNCGEYRISHELVEQGMQYCKMNGKKVFVHAIKRICEVIIEGMKKNNLSLDDIDLFVLHQANLRINDMVAEKLGVPAEKVFNTIDRYGNTTAATIPIGLNDAVKEGKLKSGMTVCSATFGSGFTWSSAFYRW